MDNHTDLVLIISGPFAVEARKVKYSAEVQLRKLSELVIGVQAVLRPVDERAALPDAVPLRWALQYFVTAEFSGWVPQVRYSEPACNPRTPTRVRSTEPVAPEK
jgi:hypothetical protein